MTAATEETPRSIADAVVVITGAAHGIGAAYARALVADGAAVVVVDLDAEGAEKLAGELRESGGRALAVRADVSSEDDLRAMVGATLGEFGTITGLVNNAAVFSVVPMSRAPFDEITLDEWDLMMRVNVRGTWQVSKAVIPAMRAAGYGKIVNISSGTALKGSASRIHYVTSKAAILGFTKVLAREVGPHGIRVNCVAPGPVWTPLIPATMEEQKTAHFGQQTPMEEAAQPDEIAPSYVFFASKAFSSYYSGEVLAPVGGETLPG